MKPHPSRIFDPLRFTRFRYSGTSIRCFGAMLLAATAPSVSQAAIAYVQGTFASVGSGSFISLAYAGAQTAGNLNVIAIGWSDSSSTIVSITDTAGNTYAAAGAPVTLSSTASQTIWYAKNIKSAAAGANTVTITFNTAAPNPDLRIAEYSGLDTVSPLDGTASGANALGTAEATAPLVTTNANDLLVAADFIHTSNAGAGLGYTIRMIDSQAQILEDETVSAVSSYTATATQAGTGYWVIYLAAFKAAGSGGTSCD